MKKDRFIMYCFMMVFTALVFFLSFDIQVELNAQRVIRKEKIKGHALIVSENKITEYVANAQIINGSSALVLNEILSSDDIKKVTSHQQALSQCSDYITLRSFDTEEANNTAIAAKAVASMNDKSLGAIASVETAEIYGLKILEANINKSGENTTRFAVLSKVKASSPSLSSSVIMFSVKNEAGSLANAISIIGKYGYNMTALRSRPLKKHSWQYYFYIEIDGTTDNETGKKMIEDLNMVCDRLKVAGTFSPHDEI